MANEYDELLIKKTNKIKRVKIENINIYLYYIIVEN